MARDAAGGGVSDLGRSCGRHRRRAAPQDRPGVGDGTFRRWLARAPARSRAPHLFAWTRAPRPSGKLIPTEGEAGLTPLPPLRMVAQSWPSARGGEGGEVQGGRGRLRRPLPPCSNLPPPAKPLLPFKLDASRGRAGWGLTDRGAMRPDTIRTRAFSEVEQFGSREEARGRVRRLLRPRPPLRQGGTLRRQPAIGEGDKGGEGDVDAGVPRTSLPTPPCRGTASLAACPRVEGRRADGEAATTPA
jgi:hypothetical protein